MFSLIKLEFKRFIKNKSMILLICSCVFTTLLSLVLSKIESKGNALTNYYIVLAQFTFIFFIPTIALYGLSNDYEKNIYYFYLQNDISLFKIYIVKNIILIFLSIVIYTISTLYYFIVCEITITTNTFHIFLLFISIIIYDIQILLFLSIICKKTILCMMSGISFWIFVQIVGLFLKDNAILSGKISLIDGNSCYARYFILYEKGTIYKTYFYECLNVCITWIIITIFMSIVFLYIKNINHNYRLSR